MHVSVYIGIIMHTYACVSGYTHSCLCACVTLCPCVQNDEVDGGVQLQQIRAHSAAITEVGVYVRIVLAFVFYGNVCVCVIVCVRMYV
jgi:hypothetical protein